MGGRLGCVLGVSMGGGRKSALATASVPTVIRKYGTAHPYGRRRRGLRRRDRHRVPAEFKRPRDIRMGDGREIIRVASPSLAPEIDVTARTPNGYYASANRIYAHIADKISPSRTPLIFRRTPPAPPPPHTHAAPPPTSTSEFDPK